MTVWLRVFRGIDVANPNADALALHDNLKRVAINHMDYTTVERRRISIQCEQQDGETDQTQMNTLQQRDPNITAALAKSDRRVR